MLHRTTLLRIYRQCLCFFVHPKAFLWKGRANGTYPQRIRLLDAVRESWRQTWRRKPLFSLTFSFFFYSIFGKCFVYVFTCVSIFRLLPAHSPKCFLCIFCWCQIRPCSFIVRRAHTLPKTMMVTPAENHCHRRLCAPRYRRKMKWETRSVCVCVWVVGGGTKKKEEKLWVFFAHTHTHTHRRERKVN